MLTLTPPRHARQTTGALVLAMVLSLWAPSPIRAQEADPDPVLEQYFIANAAYNRKLYPVAVGQFEEFLKAHPEHPKADLARRGLALSQYALKQYDKAMPQFAALLAREKLDKAISRDRVVMLYGQCLLLTGKKDDAKALFVAEEGTLTEEAYRTAARAAICDVDRQR